MAVERKCVPTPVLQLERACVCVCVCAADGPELPLDWDWDGSRTVLWWLPTRRKACRPRLREEEEGGDARIGMASLAMQGPSCR